MENSGSLVGSSAGLSAGLFDLLNRFESLLMKEGIIQICVELSMQNSSLVCGWLMGRKIKEIRSRA